MIKWYDWQYDLIERRWHIIFKLEGEDNQREMFVPSATIVNHDTIEGIITNHLQERGESS